MIVGNLTQAAELVGLEAGVPFDLVIKELMKTDMDAVIIANTISGEVIQYEGTRLPISVDVPELLQKAIHSVEK